MSSARDRGTRAIAARALAALAAAPSRRGFGPALVALAVLVQAGFYEAGLRPIPTIATAYGVSTALGLLNGRGLTVQPEEALAVRRPLAPGEDALPLYRADAERMPAHEPLPGVSLLFAGVALATGSLRLGTLVYLQMVLHGLGAWLLSAELRWRSGLAAAAAGLGWALFLPEFRSTLTPGYDSLPSLVYIAAVVCALRFGRTGAGRWLAGAGLACGAGLWVRDYLFVLPLLLLPVVIWLRRPAPAAVLAFAAPIVALALALAGARSPESGTTHRMIRGGVWHTFWAGVGQFENDLGLVAEDESVQAFAGRLAPGESFRVPAYQYLPAYDEALGQAGREYVAKEWPSLLRNAFFRTGWLVFPAMMPSKQVAAGSGRWVLLAAGLPLSLLALLGFARVWREDRFTALVLAAPLLSLLPLAPYYFIAKVPTGPSRAARLHRLRPRRPPAGEPPAHLTLPDPRGFLRELLTPCRAGAHLPKEEEVSMPSSTAPADPDGGSRRGVRLGSRGGGNQPVLS